jgi:hypothetical protein
MSIQDNTDVNGKFTVSGFNLNTVSVNLGVNSAATGGQAVAIGVNSNATANNSVCLGNIAKDNGQANSIVLNASGLATEPTLPNTIILNSSGAAFSPAAAGFFVRPDIGQVAGQVAAPGSKAAAGWKEVQYNPTTGQFAYYST